MALSIVDRLVVQVCQLLVMTIAIGSPAYQLNKKAIMRICSGPFVQRINKCAQRPYRGVYQKYPCLMTRHWHYPSHYCCSRFVQDTSFWRINAHDIPFYCITNERTTNDVAWDHGGILMNIGVSAVFTQLLVLGLPFFIQDYNVTIGWFIDRPVARIIIPAVDDRATIMFMIIIMINMLFYGCFIA